jgi:hypothetical protein
VQAIRGAGAIGPDQSWTKDKSSRFGEDLVGGWLLENGGLIEGLEKGPRIIIPSGGTKSKRTVDWLLGRRILVEVKTYENDLGQGGHASNTRQIDDYGLWRDQEPAQRAVVLARVAWEGNAETDILFKGDLSHFRIPLLTFRW